MFTQKFRSKTVRLVAALALTSLTLLTACSSDDKDVAENSIGTLRIGTIGSGNELTGPLGFALERDALVPALSEVGVEKVEIFSFPNGPDLNQALVSGKLDVSNYGDTPALIARGSGLSTRLLAIPSAHLQAGILTKEDDINSLADLEGKTIGVPKGSYIDRYLTGALAEANITPKEIIHILPTDHEAALESGQIDAAADPYNTYAALQAKGYKSIDNIWDDHPNLAGTSSSVATDDFLKKNPKFAEAWRSLQVEAAQYALDNWDDYLEFEISKSKFPPELVKEFITPETITTEPFPKDALELLNGTKDFLSETGKIQKDFEISDWIYQD